MPKRPNSVGTGNKKRAMEEEGCGQRRWCGM